MDIRPGTKPEAKISGMSYVRSQHAGFEDIRRRDIDVNVYESRVRAAITALDTAANRARLALVLMHGGHVDAGAMSACGMTEKMDPRRVLETVVKDLPTALPDTALVKR